MKTIIAEKPSVAREIARIVGATKREDGYLEGNGYAVTWALGHLVQPAMPEGYGFHGFVSDNLPIIPETFTLVPRQVKTEKGYKPDSGVTAQLKVIERLFRESGQIIVATDAGREGELIFRYLYHYLGCATPFVRLWISSLTDKAIREGLRNLQDGSRYDNLYLAAKSRSEADWLVGINSTQAVSIAAGRGTYSLGRVQTPTLAMVCERYWQNRRFSPEAFWQLHIVTDGSGAGNIKLSSVNRWKEKVPAEELYNKVKAATSATVTKAERKEMVEDTPLLYDLTTLQKEANSRYGFTAEQTLGITQKLYEKKLVTYPRTGSRYIPEDVFAEIPKLLAFIGGQPEWTGKVDKKAEPTRRSVDGSKVTDHHALLVTGEKPLFLSAEDATVYHMIAGRMIEAFSDKCVKDTTSVTAECCGAEFTAKGSIIRQPGWRDVYKEEKDEQVLPDWNAGDELTISGSSLTEGKTKPKPLHTEATLLSAMETCGKDMEDDALREALKECGIGTPATRASIIETLFARGYMQRVKKTLVPTEKGLALYSVVKTMRIADVGMTGEWENELSRIERGKASAEVFRKDIERYTGEITVELLSCGKLFGHKDSGCTCPKCGTGKMQFFGKVVRCDNAGCGLPVFRMKAGRMLSDNEIRDLLTEGKTKVLKGFKSRQGKDFDATVTFDGDFNTTFVFPEARKAQNIRKKRK
jgi:DNA topoisomerase-3